MVWLTCRFRLLQGNKLLLKARLVVADLLCLYLGLGRCALYH
jgi:hypothetical protein